MPAAEKLSITLTAEIANEVRAVVKNGEYVNSSEVIREALRDWRRKRAFETKEIDELRALWAEGVQSGTSRFSSIDEIKQAARQQLRSNHNKN